MSARRAISVGGAILGLALFAWVFWRAGPADIGRSLAGVGWLALAIPLPQLAAYIFDTLGWRASFGRRADIPPLWTLYWIRMAGEAINYLTPSAYVGGEPLKAYLVKKRGVPGTIAAASVVEAKTLMTVAEVLFLVIGAFSALGTLEVADEGPLFLGIVATIAFGGAIAAFLLWVQRRGLFVVALAVARQLGLRIGALERREEKLRLLDVELRRFYREEPGAFAASIAWHLAGWVLGAGEVWLAARLLGAPLTALDAVAVEALIQIVKGATLFVPGSIGFQETGFAFLFKLFGFPEETGVSVGILRRARELLCAGAGLGWLIWDESSLAAAREHTAAEASQLDADGSAHAREAAAKVMEETA